VDESENYGPEQEYLNTMFGARLRITTVRAASGPGIEVLEYLTPRDGRPLPTSTRANDLMHWQTTLVTSCLEAVARRSSSGRVALVSPGVMALPENPWGVKRGLLVQDPDGHVVQVIDKCTGRSCQACAAAVAVAPRRRRRDPRRAQTRSIP
jgi:hypothetical protein